MSRTLTPPRIQPDLPPSQRRLWTRDDCKFLVANGLLTGRYELVNGDIVDKMGQNPPHAYVVMLLNAWLVSVFGGLYVRIQLPINVAAADSVINEPEPDAAVLNRPALDFVTHTPDPEDVSLLIEVADSSHDYDLKTKAALYARAGVREYWVIEINERRLYVHQNPSSGVYPQARRVRRKRRSRPAYCLSIPRPRRRFIAPAARRDAQYLNEGRTLPNVFAGGRWGVWDVLGFFHFYLSWG